MDLIDNRDNTSQILEKRFIGHILREEAQQLDQFQAQLMASRGFETTEFYNNRGFQVVDDNKLQYTHPVVLRFIDMKKRSSKTGQSTPKKAHPIHNKPLFGMVNNVLRRLQFEYTDKMKKMLSKEYNIPL